MELNPDLWLSTVRAVPTIGIHSKPTYESGTDMLNLVRPLIFKWAPEAKNIDVSLEPFAIKLDEKNGFISSVGQAVVSTAFSYKGQIQEEQEEPALKFQVSRRPVKPLLDECVSKVLQLYSELQKLKQRDVELIGVVVSGHVSLDSPPPGFEAFMNHLSKPWGTSAVPFGKLMFQVDLEDGEGFDERCYHTFEWNKKAEINSGIVAFRLDWQRVFSKAKPLASSHLTVQVETCISRAFEYFGRFGMGDLAYAI